MIFSDDYWKQCRTPEEITQDEKFEAHENYECDPITCDFCEREREEMANKLTPVKGK